MEKGLELTPMRFDFTKCTPRCNREDMNGVFLEMLERAFDIYPFALNSGYRTEHWERTHGRSGTSAHCHGKAVDIATPDSRTRWYVFQALLRVGFTRFGIGKTFIHVDNDVCQTRPDRCIFIEF